MLYVGLDLSRKRINFDAGRAGGELVERGPCAPDAHGLRGLADRLLAHDEQRRPLLGRRSDSPSFHASWVTPLGVVTSPATSPASLLAGQPWGEHARRTIARDAEQKELTAEPNQPPEFRGVTSIGRSSSSHRAPRRELRRRPLRAGPRFGYGGTPGRRAWGPPSVEAGSGEPIAEPRPDASVPTHVPGGNASNSLPGTER
jgi:hypothetical protein